MASKTLRAGTISSRTGAAVALGHRDDAREERALAAVGLVSRGSSYSRVDAEEADRHDDDSRSRAPSAERAATWPSACGLRTVTSTRPGLGSSCSSDSCVDGRSCLGVEIAEQGASGTARSGEGGEKQARLTNLLRSRARARRPWPAAPPRRRRPATATSHSPIGLPSGDPQIEGLRVRAGLYGY